MTYTKSYPKGQAPTARPPTPPDLSLAASDIVSNDSAQPLRTPPRADTVDACAEMFKFCKQCDERYLQPHKIQCLFDVDSGAMERSAVTLVCEIIEILLADIAQQSLSLTRGGSLTVTLKRQQTIWILALTERHIERARQMATMRRVSLVQRHAQALGAACRVHETGEGTITALMFDSAAGVHTHADAPALLH